MSFLSLATTGLGLIGTAGSIRNLSKRKKRAKRELDRYQGELDNLVSNRQDVINPYDDATNTFSNLQVATGAAEFEADEADIALANTLDTLSSFGYGGGGATAIAQEAARAKRGISASIETQEARNQELMAAAEERTMDKIMEGERFAFDTTERREQSYINRAASLVDQARVDYRGIQQQQADIWSSFGSSLLSTGAGMFVGESGQ